MMKPTMLTLMRFYILATDSRMDDIWAYADGGGSTYFKFSIYDFVNPDDFESNYYHYWGSLTTPPCTPAVNWHLAQNTIKVRGSTMNKFRAKTAEWTTANGQVDATTNFRPVQENPSCVSQFSVVSNFGTTRESNVIFKDNSNFIPKMYELIL